MVGGRGVDAAGGLLLLLLLPGRLPPLLVLLGRFAEISREII